MAQASLAIAIQHDIGNTSSHCVLEPVTQRSIMNRSLLELFTREFHSLAKRDDARNVLRSRASLALLMSADILTMQTHTTANVKRPGAFRRIQFVRRHRQQIATKL